MKHLAPSPQTLGKLEALTKLNESAPEPPFSPLSQKGLSELRQKIKEVMLPLLIQIFHLRNAKQDQIPSRLTLEPDGKGEEATQQLLLLQQEITQLSHWCTSCLAQIERALSEDGTKAFKPHTASIEPTEKRLAHLFTKEESAGDSKNNSLRIERKQMSSVESKRPPKKTLLQALKECL